MKVEITRADKTVTIQFIDAKDNRFRMVMTEDQSDQLRSLLYMSNTLKSSRCLLELDGCSTYFEPSPK